MYVCTDISKQSRIKTRPLGTAAQGSPPAGRPREDIYQVNCAQSDITVGVAMPAVHEPFIPVTQRPTMWSSSTASKRIVR